MTNNEKIRISELTLKSLDSVITTQEFTELNNYIASSQEIADYYYNCIAAYIIISDESEQLQGESEGLDLLESASAGSSVRMDSNTSLRGVDLGDFNLDADFAYLEEGGLAKDMVEVLELERTSSAVDIPKEEPKRELIQKVESDFKWFPGRPSKFKIRTLLAMAACIMVTIGYFHFFGPKNTEQPVVAKLADSIEAVWDGKLQTPDEFGNMVQSRYHLKQGYACILLSDGAKVTVEAPAELSLNSTGDMELFSGRIYAIVPEKAHGFTVKAASSKIVDLGTEFGVEVDDRGNAQLHVTKGRTVLFAGLLNGSEKQAEVVEGFARKVYNDGFVKDLPLERHKFVRRIDSKSNLVLRDQKFNLADVIGGGNGFGTGTPEKGIDMVAARFQMFEGEKIDAINSNDFSFKFFAEHPYIDGVCIPNGGAGPVKVSSKGHIFENCPQSVGRIGAGVFNGAFHFSEVKGIPKTQSSLGGIIYGTLTNPAIYMTPNQAVTFDLDAIRKDLGGVSISSFSSKAGLSEVLLKYSQGLNPKTSFYVLVDGVVRFNKIDQQATDDFLDIRVDIQPKDRFLTIMTLQGTDGRTDFECSLFGEPSLNLE